LSSVLEIESASNDPMAIFMTVGCIEVLLGNVVLGPGLLGMLASQMLIGTVCGVAGGYSAVWLVNRINLAAAGLYPVLVSSFCLLTFGMAAWLGGSGFLAVYLAGLVIGNQKIVFQRGIRLFHDALAWLSQILMFVVLGLLCYPSRLLDVAGHALLISLVLIFIARPVAVVLATLPFRFGWREMTFMSWVGLKGAVPITLATFPLMLATPQVSLQAPLLFDVVFFIVVVSAVIQGTSLAPVARWLGLERRRNPQPAVTLEISSLQHVNGDVVDYAVGEDSRAAGRMVKDLSLPDGAVIALIARGDEIIPPQGKTRVQAGDHVILVLRPGIQALVNQVFGRNSEARGSIPDTVEFPLRGSTTVGELQEFYSIDMKEPPNMTLAEAIRRQCVNNRASLGEAVCFDRLRLRVLQLANDGHIETVGMSILPESELPPSQAGRPEASGAEPAPG
jgi:cell volume regulation protein A